VRQRFHRVPLGRLAEPLYRGAMRRLAVSLGFMLLACAKLNPAFDELDELGEAESGDGDPGDGDPGDGDPGAGDPGDGDGEGESGDGDGESESESGDGDGESGDGDGDPNEQCAGVLLDEPYDALTTTGALVVDVSNAPGFALQEADCQILTICVSDQPTCDSQSAWIVRINSKGIAVAGNAIPVEPTRIRLHFTPGKPSCGMPPLIFDPSQFIEINWVDNNLQKVVPVRLPCFEGTDLELWVGFDGSSFYDGELLHAAALW
jgi:hypothetical protein